MTAPIDLNPPEFSHGQELAVLDDAGRDTGQRVHFVGYCVNRRDQCYVQGSDHGVKSKMRAMLVKHLRPAAACSPAVEKKIARLRRLQSGEQLDMFSDDLA
jgi:hypothetical protein